MEDKDIKRMLTYELNDIHLNSEAQEKIRLNVKKSRHTKIYKLPAIIAASLVLCATTGYASYYIYNKISVNDEVLPEIDSMEVISAPAITGTSDEFGYVYKQYSHYTEANATLNSILLHSSLADNTSYESVTLDTDNKDYISINVQNYIVGDVAQMKSVDSNNHFSFEPGQTFGSPVSLSVDIILSKSQLESGMEYDFLGMYNFQEQYISKAGYKVNIVTSDNNVRDVPSEKIAIFVSDGIRYRIQGCVSTSTLKNIVNSME